MTYNVFGGTLNPAQSSPQNLVVCVCVVLDKEADRQTDRHTLIAIVRI